MSSRHRELRAFIRLACGVFFVAASACAFDEPSERQAIDLDPSWLEATRDPQTGLLSRGVRPEEGPGYFAILNHARQFPLSVLKSAAAVFQNERRKVLEIDPRFRFYFRERDARFPTYVDLHEHAAAYHGRLVTLRGHVRRVLSYPAGENPFGLQQLHEAWLYVDDAQQNPVIAVCTELPAGIPTGTDILVDHISATGYFFKRYGYEDRSGASRFAPLILAQRLEWSPPDRGSANLSNGMLFGITVGLAIVGGMIWWLLIRRRRRPMHFNDAVDNPFSTTPQD